MHFNIARWGSFPQYYLGGAMRSPTVIYLFYWCCYISADTIKSTRPTVVKYIARWRIVSIIAAVTWQTSMKSPEMSHNTGSCSWCWSCGLVGHCTQGLVGHVTCDTLGLSVRAMCKSLLTRSRDLSGDARRDITAELWPRNVAW